MGQQIEEPVIEPTNELANDPASNEEIDNVFEKILREETHQALEQTSQGTKLTLFLL